MTYSLTRSSVEYTLAVYVKCGAAASHTLSFIKKPHFKPKCVQTADKGLALSKYTKVLIDLFQKVVGF